MTTEITLAPQGEAPSLAENSVRLTPVEAVMRQAFHDYAMSVITSRALPDVRDGFKPVHLRILWAMYESRNLFTGKYRKSARMVGDVIGKYHPHGDTSVYEAAVLMAQSFSLAEPLIDGQGNFGSIDGDNAAAMRYTEMRLSKIAGEFFTDLDKETVSWQANYDGEFKEPTVLPVPLPLLLVNGGSGIAVGMASNVAPHNLASVVDATLLLMSNPQATTAELVGVLEAPDFPTGGIVHGLDGFASAVETGTGRVMLRSKWHEEDSGRNAKAIVIDELPFKVQKAALVARIAELSREKRIEGIVTVRDESSKEGIRVFIGLSAGTQPEVVFAELASKTDVETAFNYNTTVLINGLPQTVGLRDVITHWLAFREDVVRKRYVFERKQARARLHILQGFMAALGALDKVIELVRASSDASSASVALMELLALDEDQVKEILALRLQKLTGMELDSIRGEHRAVTLRVEQLTALIDDPDLIRGVIRSELAELKATYGRPRRTEVGHGISSLTREDLIAREDVLIAMTQGGYVKRMPTNAMERQNRGTRGRKAMSIGDDDTISFMQQAHSHDTLLVFCADGQVHGIKAYRLPEGSMTSKGRHIRNVIEGLDQSVSAVVAIPESDPNLTVLTITRKGTIKRTKLDDYASATRKGGVRGMGLDEGDVLQEVFVVREEDHIMLVSSAGNCIRFSAADARVMGRSSVGVRGIRLDGDEHVIGAMVINGGKRDDLFLLCVGANGVGKRTPVADFTPQFRGGGGVIAFRANGKTGRLVAALGVTESQDLIMFSSNGVSNRISVDSVRETQRAASGVFLMNIDEGQEVVSATTTTREEKPEADPAVGGEAVQAAAVVAEAAAANGDAQGAPQSGDSAGEDLNSQEPSAAAGDDESPAGD